MKLLTLNCHAWQEENQLEKIRHLAQVIKEREYDVIALQEVMQLIDTDTEDKVKRDNYAVVLLNELMKLEVTHYQFIWDFSHIGYDIYEEGLAILTRCEIKNARSFVISQCTDVKSILTRRIVALEIIYQDKPVHIFSCHLGWFHDQDESYIRQVDQLVAQLQPNQINLLMGDFNSDANIRDEGYDYLISKGLMDTYHVAKVKDEGSTVIGKIDGWDQNQEGLRIDLILTNQPIEVEYSAVIFNGKHKEIVSDHFGVEVELAL